MGLKKRIYLAYLSNFLLLSDFPFTISLYYFQFYCLLIFSFESTQDIFNMQFLYNWKSKLYCIPNLSKDDFKIITFILFLSRLLLSKVMLIVIKCLLYSFEDIALFFSHPNSNYPPLTFSQPLHATTLLPSEKRRPLMEINKICPNMLQ